jgi:hypothetical protein
VVRIVDVLRVVRPNLVQVIVIHYLLYYQWVVVILLGLYESLVPGRHNELAGDLVLQG